MDHYRMINGPPPNCKSLIYLPRIFEYALPKANVNEDSFQALQAREGVEFYPKNVTDVIQHEDGKIILSCPCERCTVSRKTSKIENDTRISKLFDANEPSKLLLIILIYLARADLIHILMKKGVTDKTLGRVPSALEDYATSLESLFNPPKQQTVIQFCNKFNEVSYLFQPVNFQLDKQFIEYSKAHRFPFLDEQDHASGSSAKVRKLNILPDYLAQDIIEADWYKELGDVSIS